MEKLLVWNGCQISHIGPRDLQKVSYESRDMSSPFYMPSYEICCINNVSEENMRENLIDKRMLSERNMVTTQSVVNSFMFSKKVSLMHIVLK